MRRRGEEGDNLGFHESSQGAGRRGKPGQIPFLEFQELALLWLRRREFKEGNDTVGSRVTAWAWPGAPDCRCVVPEGASCTDSTAEPELEGMWEGSAGILSLPGRGRLKLPPSVLEF